MKPVPRLHLLTNTTLQSRFTHLDLARAAFESGAEVVVQYRNKAYDPCRHLLELQAIAQLPRSSQQKLILNDDPALALEVGAEGAHVGMEDTPPEKAREILGPDRILGATVHNEAELAALEGVKIDYIGLGPVFGTQSKEVGLPPLGLEKLAHFCAISPFPVIAIGNISLENAAQVLEAGAHGFAILSGFCLVDEPKQAVRALDEIIQKFPSPF